MRTSNMLTIDFMLALSTRETNQMQAEATSRAAYLTGLASKEMNLLCTHTCCLMSDEFLGWSGLA